MIARLMLNFLFLFGRRGHLMDLCVHVVYVLSSDRAAYSTVHIKIRIWCNISASALSGNNITVVCTKVEDKIISCVIPIGIVNIADIDTGSVFVGDNVDDDLYTIIAVNKSSEIIGIRRKILSSDINDHRLSRLQVAERKNSAAQSVLGIFSGEFSIIYKRLSGHSDVIEHLVEISERILLVCGTDRDLIGAVFKSILSPAILGVACKAYLIAVIESTRLISKTENKLILSSLNRSELDLTICGRLRKIAGINAVLIGTVGNHSGVEGIDLADAADAHITFKVTAIVVLCIHREVMTGPKSLGIISYSVSLIGGKKYV